MKLSLKTIDWPVCIWFVIVHAGALAAPFTFSWTGLGLMIALSTLTGMGGVTIGYHRLLTHGSFETYPWMRIVFAFLGGLSGQGSALHWIAKHRKHHQFSDEEGDPHSPKDHHFWWSHILWMLERETPAAREALHRKYAPDLYQDGAMRFLDKTFIVWHLLLGAALLSGGWLADGWRFGCSLLVWGLFLRMTYVFHGTWLVNSATHTWGYRNYDTDDRSTNLWWVALITWGEGWHNNHHRYPTAAAHGHKWWEVDVSYLSICLLRWLRLAWNVKSVPAP